MDYELISRTALFQGCSPTATENLLYGLKTFTKKYKKGAPIVAQLSRQKSKIFIMN